MYDLRPVSAPPSQTIETEPSGPTRAMQPTLAPFFRTLTGRLHVEPSSDEYVTKTVCLSTPPSWFVSKFASHATYTRPRNGLPAEVSTVNDCLSLNSAFERVARTTGPHVLPPSVERLTPIALSGAASSKSRLQKYARLPGPNATHGSEARSHDPPLASVRPGASPSFHVAPSSVLAANPSARAPPLA